MVVYDTLHLDILPFRAMNMLCSYNMGMIWTPLLHFEHLFKFHFWAFWNGGNLVKYDHDFRVLYITPYIYLQNRLKGKAAENLFKL